ncbi:hypothetical protein ABT126_26115 [Streptomyces sp. NPDC002012]|uniref:hypothetical protein n=1 Tax=unclassified Streptomyces TaxID=2593676 RepID=UPI003328B325
MITIAEPAPVIPAFMLVVSVVFICFGVLFLSARGAVWARDRVEKQRENRVATHPGPSPWTYGREARLTRLLALVWVVAGSAIAVICAIVLALG